jgi:aspartate racemase
MRRALQDMRKRRIGILGGISHESTIKYYEFLLKKYFEREKNYYYPEIVIFSLNFQKVTNFEDTHNKEGYIKYLMEGINALERTGVDFILIAANSPHSVYEQLVKLTKVPILSIIHATAKKAIDEKLKNLLLLGIKFTMQSDFYQNYFEKQGIKVLTPNVKDQDIINDIIFKELVLGIVKEESRKKLEKIINKFKVDGVILGCTELPLIIKNLGSNVKLLDTLELHLNYALEVLFSETLKS